MEEITDVVSRFRDIKNGIPFRKKATSIIFGEHRSPYKEAGYEMTEVTFWEKGDSLRDVDWGMSFPTFPDEIYIIKRIEEKEIPIILGIDISTSMLYRVEEGSNKGKLMLELMGILGFTATRVQDPIGLACFSDDIEFYLRPRARSKFVYYMAARIFEKLEWNRKRPRIRRTNLNKFIQFVAERFSARRAIIVISDFVDVINRSSELNYKLLQRLAVKHDLMFLILDDPQEFALKHRWGSLRTRDIESGKIEIIPLRKMKKIRERIEEGQRELIDKLQKINIDAEVFTYGNHFEDLNKFFEKRRRARR